MRLSFPISTESQHIKLYAHSDSQYVSSNFITGDSIANGYYNHNISLGTHTKLEIKH